MMNSCITMTLTKYDIDFHRLMIRYVMLSLICEKSLISMRRFYVEHVVWHLKFIFMCILELLV